MLVFLDLPDDLSHRGDKDWYKGAPNYDAFQAVRLNHNTYEVTSNAGIGKQNRTVMDQFWPSCYFINAEVS